MFVHVCFSYISSLPTSDYSQKNTALYSYLRFNPTCPLLDPMQCYCCTNNTCNICVVISNEANNLECLPRWLFVFEVLLTLIHRISPPDEHRTEHYQTIIKTTTTTSGYIIEVEREARGVSLLTNM